MKRVIATLGLAATLFITRPLHAQDADDAVMAAQEATNSATNMAEDADQNALMNPSPENQNMADEADQAAEDANDAEAAAEAADDN
jgi:hypothetical protein